MLAFYKNYITLWAFWDKPEKYVRTFLVFLTLVSLVGCNPSAGKPNPVGALTGLEEFEIVPFFSPYDELNNEQLLKALVSSLEKIGNVKTREGSIDSSTYVLVSVVAEDAGSIQAFGDVEAKSNKFKTACAVWRADVSPENPLYPEVENGKVLFKRSEFSREEKNSSTEVVEALIHKFAQEYNLDNSPGKRKPVFYLHTPIFQT